MFVTLNWIISFESKLFFLICMFDALDNKFDGHFGSRRSVDRKDEETFQ